MHKYKIITIITIIIILTIAFNYFKISYDKFAAISITDVDSKTYEDLGYIKKAQTENVQYYFAGENEKEDKKLTIELEDAFKKIKEKFNLSPNKSMKIYFDSDLNNAKKTTRLSVFMNNTYSIGSILEIITQSKLPAWLNTGIELNLINNSKVKVKKLASREISTWINEAKNRNLPSFGDAWFITDLIDDPLRNDVNNISYTFINYLDKKNILSEIVSLYMKDNKEQAESIINEEWTSFIGTNLEKIDSLYKFSFLYDDIRFEVHTEKIVYQFYDNNWNYETIQYYIEYFKKSVEYVEQWFGHKLKENVVCKISDKPGQSETSENIINLRSGEIGMDKMAHEFTHSISFELGVSFNFAPFTEGLANVIMYSLNEELKDIDFNLDFMKRLAKINEDKNDPEAYKFTQNYKKFSKNKLNSIDTLDYYAYFMAKACYDFEDENYNDSLGSFKYYKPNSINTNYIADLNGYDKSTSFVFYLIEKYGKDNFMKVYYDLDLFKDIYGKDILEIVKEWKIYLGLSD